MAKKHSMQSIVYICIEKCREQYGTEIIDDDLYLAWKQSYLKALKRLILFDIEREELNRFLDKNGIWHLSLKGAVLQHYYPTLGMRQMTDNDILVDAQYAEKIRDYMTARGYTAYSYGRGCHDTYIKDSLNFEIHRKLVSETKQSKKAVDYYKNVRQMLQSDPVSSELYFNDEDFYVYFIYHAYKHFASAGCGLRTLMDIAVFMKSKADGLNFNYVEAQLSRLGIAEYERMSRRIALLLFSEEYARCRIAAEPLSEDERAMLNYYISSGTFGTELQRIENNLSRMSDSSRITRATKLRYFLRRIFPDMDYYRNAHPVAHKFIVTIPVLWAVRIVRGLRKSRAVAGELKHLKKIE